MPKEFQLFQFLYQRPSRVFTREELLDVVWPKDAPTGRTVDDHIYRIRKKLAPLSSVVKIKSVRGQGYALWLNREVHESPLLEDEKVSSSAKELPEFYRLGIRLLSRLPFLIFAKQLDKAESLLLISEKEIREKNLEGFIPLIYLTDICFS